MSEIFREYEYRYYAPSILGSQLIDHFEEMKSIERHLFVVKDINLHLKSVIDLLPSHF